MRRVALLVMLFAGVVAAQDPAFRPRLEVRDGASGCPGVSGAFVALLEPAQGMLLLSGAPFPGGVQAPAPSGEPVRLGSWSIDEVAAEPGRGSVWWGRYPFVGEAGRGCVAFDRDRFSAEGDLVSYMRWVVEKVYLQLPPEERVRHPAFTLSNRLVGLRVEQEGFSPLRLEGREGSTLAFRVAGTESTCFLFPFVLDPTAGRLAIRSAVISRQAFAPAEADWRAFVVVEPGEQVPLPELAARVVVEGIVSAADAGAETAVAGRGELRDSACGKRF